MNSEIIQVLRGTGSMGIRTLLLTVFKLFFLFFTDTFNVKLNSRATCVMQCYLMPWLRKIRSSPHVCSICSTQKKQLKY